MSPEGLPWLKLWHSFLDSVKIQSVTEALRARYVNLLCVACKFGENGKLPDITQVAFMIRLSSDDAQETLERLIEARLIERRGKAYYIHDWDQWQHKKSRDAEKQKRYRDNIRTLRNEECNDPVTRYVTDGNASPRVREELEREKEGDKKTPLKVPKGTPSFVLPDWIPKQLWESYLEMRKKIRKPATEHAKELVIAKLIRLQADGNDPIAVLEQSIMQCNQGVWPVAIPYANRNTNGAAQPSKPQPQRTPEEEAKINAALAKRLNY